MNREILFRGKRTDNGEWVEGHLIVYPRTKRTKIMVWEWADLEFNAIEVRPETVGQFAGLTDKNGKRIFEGDIVRYFQRLLGGVDYEHKDPVLFLEGGFTVGVYFLNNWLRDGSNRNIQLEGIEVIGNIHDNPELLEVTK